MLEFYEAATSWVVLPATLTFCLLFVWSLLTLVLGSGGDSSISDWIPGDGSVPGGSLSMETEGTLHAAKGTALEALGGVIMAPAKWLNLRDLPLVVWGGIFALTWWALSMLAWFLCDTNLFGKELSGWLATILLVRNVAIALFLTKLATNPMRNLFASHELGSVDLVGQEALIWSYDASPEHGQARYKTTGAPLLLNVRTDGPILPKETRVWITHYDARKRIYFVSATTTSSPLNNQSS